MIVKTLQVQKVITNATFICTELGMAKLKNGDLVHVEPDYANMLIAKYPEQFKDLSHSDRPGQKTKWTVEPATPSTERAAATVANTAPAAVKQPSPGITSKSGKKTTGVANKQPEA